MIKIKITENYAGFEISGDYEDFNFLYDSINYLIKDESETIGEYTMQNHLYGFLYEVRHTYQGSRDFELIKNGLVDEDRELFGIRKRDVTDNNLYFKFYYMLPDLIQDMILIKYFIKKVTKKENNIYNLYINNVNLFYSYVLKALKEIITEIQFSKVKKGLLNSYMLDTLFIPQWFEIISIDYANMNKNKRKKELMHTLDKIYNSLDYQDYYDMKNSLEEECEEKNCTLDDIHYDGYPDEIEW